MERLLFIDGEWQAAAAGATAGVVDPATGQEVGSSAEAGVADLERAVVAADVDGAAWREATGDERSRVLRRAGDLVDERVDEIAHWLTR